jgi:DNA-binding response OmpR family regulator
MLRDRPRLLVIDDDPARRIAFTSVLGAAFDAWPLPADEDPLKVARTSRPDLALVVYGGRRTDGALRLIRTLRTDTRPIPRVAAVEDGARPRGAFVARELWMADGWLGLPNEDDVLLAFAEAVWRGERPAIPAKREPGAIRRLLRRFRSEPGPVS